MKVSNVATKFVTKHLGGLLNCMNLIHYTITVSFGKLRGATMQIEVDHRYLDAEITVDTKQLLEHWKNGQRRKILCSLAHELTHIITSEQSDPFQTKEEDPKKMSKLQHHFEERVTEHISKLVVRLYLLENKL